MCSPTYASFPKYVMAPFRVHAVDTDSYTNIKKKTVSENAEVNEKFDLYKVCIQSVEMCCMLSRILDFINLYELL